MLFNKLFYGIETITTRIVRGLRWFWFWLDYVLVGPPSNYATRKKFFIVIPGAFILFGFSQAYFLLAPGLPRISSVWREWAFFHFLLPSEIRYFVFWPIPSPRFHL